VARDAGGLPRPCRRSGDRGRVRELRSRRLPDQPIRAGTKLSLHQDKDEADYAHPIVSVSLGLPTTFQFGGAKRSDPVRKVALAHGDVVVWGGPSRLFHHGVLTLKSGEHPLTGRRRFNLTLRKAL